MLVQLPPLALNPHRPPPWACLGHLTALQGQGWRPRCRAASGVLARAQPWTGGGGRGDVGDLVPAPGSFLPVPVSARRSDTQGLSRKKLR